ncbi:MAG TPA: prepilin-type N-terminal cleavage/methylation domain-containing protein [Thermoanaerobaculia bacterium]|nr:prepilin-type N-terminal cleavage/methylation domain-containing protein [Thermoanaerobaculia bacterium]
MRAPRRDRGFSLVEVLISLFILATGLLGLLPLYVMGARANASSNQLSAVNAMAREKLEQLRAYPSTDKRLAIPTGASLADTTNNTSCANDLPAWWKPATGETSTQTTSPGAGWYPYPCRRTYTIQAFAAGNLAAPVSSSTSDESVYNQPGAPPSYYDVKLVTVTVTPTGGPLRGLRTTRQSTYLRFRNANPS